MSSYPKWLYHPTKEATVVPDEAAHKALGAEWVESPADVKPKAKLADLADKADPQLGHSARSHVKPK